MNRHLTHILSALALSLATATVWADNNRGADNNASANNTTTYYINAPRFVRPILSQWISDYEQSHGGVRFAIAKTAETRQNSALDILTSESEPTSRSHKTFVARYAILPAVAKGSVAEQIVRKHNLNSKRIKALFFLKDDISENEPEPDGTDKAARQLTVYSAMSANSITAAFARFYSEDAGSYRGKKIAGDDAFLNQALAKDTKGITVNAVSNLFDIDSRQPVNGISVVAVDKDGQEAVSNLDKLLTALQSGSDNKDVDIEKIGFGYQDNKDLSDFVNWVATNGSRYTQRFGFLPVK